MSDTYIRTDDDAIHEAGTGYFAPGPSGYGTTETFIHDSELPDELCPEPNCPDHCRHRWSLLPIGEDARVRTYWCSICEATYRERWLRGRWQHS